MYKIIFYLLCFGFIAGLPPQINQGRIVGGSPTTIEQYPFSVVILQNERYNWEQNCGGSILNNRAVLTAQHCVWWGTYLYLIRSGSTFASSGGNLHTISRVIPYPDNVQDIAIVHVTQQFEYGIRVQRGRIGSFFVGGFEPVTAIGWGRLGHLEPKAEQLQHVELLTFTNEECGRRWRRTIGDDFICAGVYSGGGRDQCRGDSGSPLLHHGVIVGVCVWGHPDCGADGFPGVNMRVSRFTPWIEANV